MVTSLHSIGPFLAAAPPNLAKMAHVTSYRGLALSTAETRVVVFCGLDQLTPKGRHLASMLVNDRRVPRGNRLRVLNEPQSVPGRYHQLRKLYSAGFNRFRAWRLSHERPTAYPVFVRHETLSGPPLTALIASAAGLDQALDRLKCQNIDHEDLIAIQWSAAPDECGLYYKYSAFRVGSEIIPAHLYLSQYWWVRSKNRWVDARSHALEESYLRENPHQKELMRAFDLCGIDYGRADYGIQNGNIVLYEINLDPVIIHPSSHHVFQDDLIARISTGLLKLIESEKGTA